MQTFYGEIGKRLTDVDGHARFEFAHVSGVLMHVLMKSDIKLPRENEPAIATGEVIGPKIIFAEEIQQATQPGVTGDFKPLPDRLS